MKLVRPMILLMLNNNISFTAVHIPGKFNILSDSLSRSQVNAELLNSHGMNIAPLHIPAHLMPQNLNLA